MKTSKPKFVAVGAFAHATKMIAGQPDLAAPEPVVDSLPHQDAPVKWDISGNGHLETCDARCLYQHCPKCGAKVARDSLSIYCEKDRDLWRVYIDRD